jgi:mRNA-degrading endonuclease RelE of RelBE toxin-antitoxin system
LRNRVEFTPSALKALASMGKADRRFVLDGIRIHLIENDPSQITRNKFPFKRPSVHTERVLRLNNWRVFYTVTRDRRLIVINLIGEKRNDRLFIEGEEFEL